MSIRRFALGAVALALLAALLWWGKVSWRPAEDAYPDQGLVVAGVDGPVNWALVRGDGADFVYLLASWGSNGRSTRFHADWSDAAKAGLRRGAVHRYSLCQLARDQATNFIAMVPRDADELPPTIELDLTEDCTARPARATVLQEVASFVRAVESHLGKLIVVRVSRAFDAEYQVSRAMDRSLWLSSFFFLPAYGERPWVMWEANQARYVDGVEQAVPWVVVRP